MSRSRESIPDVADPDTNSAPTTRTSPLIRACFCSPNWTRTSNLPINSRLLCQLSYRGLLGGLARTGLTERKL